MIRSSKATPVLLSLVALAVSGLAHANQPLITFTPITPTTIKIAPTTTQYMFYTVTNNSTKTHTLNASTLPPGVTVVTTGQGNCPSPFVLRGGKSCTLSLLVNGSTILADDGSTLTVRPKVCQITSSGAPSPYLCYQSTQANALNIQVSQSPTPPPGSASLTVSPQFVGLNAGGASRTFVVTNNGSTAATPVSFTTTAIPSGTTITYKLGAGNFGPAANCSSISPGITCTIQITPGATPNSPVGVLDYPTPTTFTINSANSNNVTPQFEVVTYGSIYQSSYLFNINDAATPSIGGSGIGLTDLPYILTDGSTFWAPVADTTLQLYPGQFTPCNSALDGACNTTQIVNTYGNSQSYAANGCQNTVTDGYTGWYLPTICQFVYTADSSCNSLNGNTIMQNVSSFLTHLYSEYWTSNTVISSISSYGYAIYVFDQSTPGSYLYAYAANDLNQVRCARDLTQPS